MPKRKATTASSPKAKKSRTMKAPVPIRDHYSGSSGTGPSQTQSNIKKVFDNYRDAPKEEPDKIAFEGVVQYLEHLGIGLDDLAFVAIFDLVEAPAMGEMTREAFVTGWTNASTPSNPCDTIDRQKEHAKVLSDRMSNDPAYFRQIYKKCFQYAKPEGQRAVPVEESFAFWDMFYGGGKNGISWNTSKVKWYDLWKEYYTSKNNRPVNKDLWNQMAELVSKTREPNGESLAWWTEDGAWPTAIDEYVAFVKERHSPAESSSSS